nr:DNA-directed RNA polymerase subunit beta [Lentibacillus sediminis]
MANNESQEQSRKAYKASKKGKKQTAAAEKAAETQTSEAAAEKQTRKQQKQARKQEKSSARPTKRRRVFPIWLRLIVVLLLAAGAMMIGLMVGYGVLGDGNPLDALRLETWQHIVNIVVGE